MAIMGGLGQVGILSITRSSDSNPKSGRMCVSLFYPEYLCITDNTGFKFELDGKQVVVATIKHLTPLEILDFDNSIVPKDKVSMPDKRFFTVKNSVENISDTQIPISVNSMIVKLLDYKNYLHRLFTPRFYMQVDLLSFFMKKCLIGLSIHTD